MGGFALRYYSIMFALAFIGSYLILSKIYVKENISIQLLNKLAIFVFIGTLVGARLGHTLFYEFSYYKHHLLKIILPFRIANGKFELNGYQGLASHGGAIGIVNSEIIGKATNASWAFIFERVDTVPRHPAQLYEAVLYLAIFLFFGFYIKTWPIKSKMVFYLAVFWLCYLVFISWWSL